MDATFSIIKIGSSIDRVLKTLEDQYTQVLNTTSGTMGLFESEAWEVIFLRVLQVSGLGSLFVRNEYMLEERSIELEVNKLPLLLELYRVLLTMPDIPPGITIPSRYGVSSRAILKAVFSTNSIINVDFAKMELVRNIEALFDNRLFPHTTVYDTLKVLSFTSWGGNILTMHPQLSIVAMHAIASRLVVRDMVWINPESKSNDDLISSYISYISGREYFCVDKDGVSRTVGDYLHIANIGAASRALSNQTLNK